ncbi:TonB-dependent receptor [Kiritimatiellaeota bacterium B1221]|nr:TonB-dependent receptor [Kiritimatiellaeota bacterium B1221]
MRWIYLLMSGVAVLGFSEEAVELAPLEVSATRSVKTPFEQPYAFYRTDAEGLEKQVGRTALDRFNYGPGVFIQRTAPNQASPFIRGLTGEQALLMLDGVRFNHAMMRPGPNQYSALIPAMSLSSIDAVLGGSSAVMGSDGLTGALDFRLATAGRGVAEAASPWVATRVDTANGATLQGGVDGFNGNWAYSFELSGSQFHDRVGGADADDHVFGSDKGAYDGIPNTAYDESSAALRLAYFGFDDRVIEVKSGYTQQSDAPRPDGYFENTGKDDRVSRYYDPQEFAYVHLRDQWQVDSELVDRLQTTLWWHRFGENQIREDWRDDGATLRRREYDDQLDALGLDMQATTLWQGAGAHELTWGGTVSFENTENSYEEYRNGSAYNSGNWSNSTTISDDSEYLSLGLFAQDDWQMNETFKLLSSLRYSRYDWSFGDVDGDADDVSGGLRGEMVLTESQRLFAGVSKAFRAPNLVNLDGAVDRGSNGVEAEGNPDLDPETSWTYEGGWKWQEAKNAFSVTVFHTRVEDLIQQEFSDGQGTFTNVEDAELQGFESAWDVGKDFEDYRLALVGSVSLVDATKDVPQADGTVLEDNISRANRLYGRVGIKVQRESNWWALLQMRWHADYDEVSSDDGSDIRLTVAGNPDGSMPGYEVFDVMLGWESDDGKINLSLYVENLADETYREIGSGVDAAGRNLGMTAGLRF